MSDLLSPAEIASFTGDAVSLFDTASQFHTCVVIKKPTKTIVSSNDQNEYAGYGNTSNVENYILVPNSGIFNVVVVTTKKSYDAVQFPAVPFYLDRGNKLIKTRQDCSDFITNGENDLVILDGIEYNQISNPMPRTYGNLTYFYFNLERTT